MLQPAFAVLSRIVAFISVAVFLLTNRAFSMMALGGQYAAAATEARRSALAAAGEAMLAVGQGHTPGTFLAFLLAVLFAIGGGLLSLAWDLLVALGIIRLGRPA